MRFCQGCIILGKSAYNPGEDSGPFWTLFYWTWSLGSVVVVVECFDIRYSWRFCCTLDPINTAHIRSSLALVSPHALGSNQTTFQSTYMRLCQGMCNPMAKSYINPGEHSGAFWTLFYWTWSLGSVVVVVGCFDIRYSWCCCCQVFAFRRGRQSQDSLTLLGEYVLVLFLIIHHMC